MHLSTRNVNTAFQMYVQGIHDGSLQTRQEKTRNGPVLQIDEPVMTTYEKPLERVLFNQGRDCNPFMHVYEAMWMLAGRNDVSPLAYYAPQVKNYSDDGETFNGAYGYRWRHANTGHVKDKAGNVSFHGVDSYTPEEKWRVEIRNCWQEDQLDVIVKHLKKKPNSRRVNLQMWNVEDDLLKIDTGKDVCCNTNVYFSLRELINGADDKYDRDRGARPKVFVLDMTVCNRSNDLVWGMLGANIVHFSFLQEYLACRLGVEVGRYIQFSNNLHVYTENNSGFHPEKWLANSEDLYTVSPATNMVHVPLVRDPVMFDREVKEFVELNRRELDDETLWVEPFFTLVAQPMCNAFHRHKARDYASALAWCSEIHATDWRVAATQWIIKRRNNYQAKTQKDGE